MHKAVKKRICFVLFVITLIATLWFVLVWQLKTNMLFFYTPTELINAKHFDKNIWIGGIVKKYQQKESDNFLIHAFIVTDNSTDIEVEYIGLLPDLFKVGQGIVVYGKFNDKKMNASKIAVKHDEVYMTKETHQRKFS